MTGICAILCSRIENTKLAGLHDKWFITAWLWKILKKNHWPSQLNEQNTMSEIAEAVLAACCGPTEPGWLNTAPVFFLTRLQQLVLARFEQSNCASVKTWKHDPFKTLLVTFRAAASCAVMLHLAFSWRPTKQKQNASSVKTSSAH